MARRELLSAHARLRSVQPPPIRTVALVGIATKRAPGFLFLAPQNGRPAGEPQKPRLDQVRRRMRAVRLAHEVGIEEACQQLEVARRSLYRWLAAFEARGIVGLVDGSRRPRRLPVAVPKWVDIVSLAAAEQALARFAEHYNYHRLSGVLGWITPAERYDGTPLTDQGFQNIPALGHLQPWLEEAMRAA
jgi:AraC-like DNA-binding protein